MTLPSNLKDTDETLSAIQNDKFNKIPTDSTNDLSSIYEHHIAHAAEIKFINERCVTPVTVEFGSSESDNSVNFLAKQRISFTALNLLDPSLSITINDTAINRPGEFPMGTAYTETCNVINDKKPRYPRVFVDHDIHSKIKLTALKFGYHNIMSTVQSLNTLLNLNRLSTHREASISFIKYIGTGLILQPIAKKRVTTALMNVDISPENISALQKTTEKDTIHNNKNKRKPDRQLKEAETNRHRIIFPAFDLSTKRIGFRNGSKRVTTVAYEVKCDPAHSIILKITSHQIIYLGST